MNILVAHNYYKLAGGEDQCVAAEVAMLRAHGHRVTQYCLSNDAIDEMGRLELASRTLWSRPAFLEIHRLIRAHRPQVVHFHNTFPLISPAAYYAARAEGVPVVQTLHNFRLICVNALLFRDGKPCEDCLGRTVAWRGVARSCYRNSRAASAAVAAMITTHHVLGTWRNAVDAYVALSEFSRRKFIEGGLPADKIGVKANFVYPDPCPGAGNGGYAVYVGRLSAEKGVETLLRAWRSLGQAVPLKIAGDGPLAPAVQEAAAQNPAIQWLRDVSHESVYDLIGAAAFLVLPSQCYENAPRVVVEAFAKGTPIIVSRLGAMAETVDDGRNGLRFAPGNAEDLTAKVRCLFADASKLNRMRSAARESFEQNFTAEVNHRALMAIYARAMDATSRHHLQMDTIAAS
jgi:glycosyltransferase involved in cell wall biosynthesis